MTCLDEPPSLCCCGTEQCIVNACYTLEAFNTTLDNGVCLAPCKASKFDVMFGGCGLWFCAIDMWAAVAPKWQGKRSEWVNKKIPQWQKLFEKYDFHNKTVRKSAPQKDDVDAGASSDRVLPYHGLSSIGTATALATMACSKPHLGGLANMQQRELCKGVLGHFIATSGLPSFTMRLDPHTRSYCSSHRPVFVSSGVEVTIPMDGTMNVDFGAWHAACLADGAPKSAVTIASYVGSDGTTCKVLFFLFVSTLSWKC